ncbi:GPALPP motifs-containing protein 1 isoform X1 [Eupeodes corollae]|uniref:GPALPP motifs-containing protein 1 isoform X1 n=1 Tax=Eupeodes corollae TaxID=290404 RepID=UPI002490EDC7|nr:GPALPP motifs-containing protein 1 isoform X1 [Eupeodes corollae]XP_055907895.1 GPALPP motifs-containing protein 1 isoform X1 [Eupeodes corollae]
MSDSDSSSKKRSEKKHKKKEKKQKKDKKHKHKKRSRKSSVSETSNVVSDSFKTPEVNLTVSTPAVSTTEIIEESFGPALPPHLLSARNNESKIEEVSVIGPSLPDGIVLQTQDPFNEERKEDNDDDDDDDGEEVFGPLPTDSKSFAKMTTAQIKLEERALEMKLAMLDPDANKEEINAREEWMLELPDVGLRTGIASLKRTFHTKERPDFSDRTSWTKTPNSNNEPTPAKVTESSKSKAEEKYQKQRDAEQEKIAKKLKKKHKRDESLYEIHQKKLKKDKKEKEINGKPERRPFSRDVDLQLNKIDKNQTKKIVDKAKFLDSRFSSGNAKYL